MNHLISLECISMDNINEIKFQYGIINRYTRSYNILFIKYNLIWTKLNNIKNNPQKVKQIKLLKEHAFNYKQMLSTVRDNILRAKKRIEIFKVSTFVKYANRSLSEGKSVVIYVNFVESIDIIIEELGIGYGIHNGKTHEENTNAIFNFRLDKVKVIVCTVQFANIGGFMLADTVNGNFPRNVIISGAVLLDILHKICREGCKTPTMQTLMFCEGTVEEEIYNKMKTTS